MPLPLPQPQRTTSAPKNRMQIQLTLFVACNTLASNCLLIGFSSTRSISLFPPPSYFPLYLCIPLSFALCSRTFAIYCTKLNNFISFTDFEIALLLHHLRGNTSENSIIMVYVWKTFNRYERKVPSVLYPGSYVYSLLVPIQVIY